nr:MAG: hypothetical protein [Microvirus sp.]
MSKKRFKIPARKSKKMFTKNAKRINRKNGLNPMRGGIRL